MARIVDIVDRVEEIGAEAHAITDHGTLAGIPEFYWTMKKHNKVPILGMELYVDEEPRSRFPAHLTVLVKNERGYRQLIEINNLAQNQFYDRPRITYEQLWKMGCDGLVALSGCMSARASKYVLAGHLDVAEAFYAALRRYFGEDFYFEIQNHTSDEEEFNAEQRLLANTCISLSSKMGIRAVFTNDCHYTNSLSENVHRELIRLGKQKDGNDYRGLEFSGSGFYIKDADEIALAIPKALRETLMGTSCEIAKSIGNITIPELTKTHWHMPKLVEDPDEQLVEMAKKAGRLKGRGPEYKARWDHELRIIKEANFAANYLLTLDYVQWARDNNILVGPGRGSMTGSLVSFAIGITDIDPVEHNLLFERAINPARPSIPDFDVDFSSKRRQEVFDYLVGQYGDNAMHIGTTAKYSLKGSLKAVGRVLGLEFQALNNLTKELEETGVTFEDEAQLWAHPRMQGLVEDFPLLPAMVSHMVGIPYAQGEHAAGMVISDNLRPLLKEVPLARVVDGRLKSAFDMEALKKMGFVKFDILGLSSLDVIYDAAKMAGIEIQFYGMKYDDPLVFETISAGNYHKLFQIEGMGSIQVIKAMGGVREFEDIVAMNALGRPGAIQFLRRFCDWRRDHSKIVYPDKALAPILDVTHGVVLYQEQVMAIAKEIAGFDDRRVDDVKEAIKFFRDEVFAEMEPEFLEGCLKNGIQNGQEIYEMIKAFAGYGFNRAHAVAYSAIGYMTAWLKTYHPAAFYAAALNNAEADAYQPIIAEARRMGINFLPPDVNESEVGFKRINDHTVLFGIESIAYCSINTAAEIISKRPFTSRSDFESRVAGRKCNARARANLEAVGAFRSFPDVEPVSVGERRKNQRELIKVAIEYSQAEQEKLLENNPENGIRVGFMASDKRHVTAKGDAMGWLKLEDGGVDVTLFSQQWMQYKNLRVRQGDLVVIHGESSEYNGRPGFIGKEVRVVQLSD
jgi:DNA polymerase-3 subunit alpha